MEKQEFIKKAVVRIAKEMNLPQDSELVLKLAEKEFDQESSIKVDLKLSAERLVSVFGVGDDAFVDENPHDYRIRKQNESEHFKRIIQQKNQLGIIKPLNI